MRLPLVRADMVGQMPNVTEVSSCSWVLPLTADCQTGSSSQNGTAASPSVITCVTRKSLRRALTALPLQIPADASLSAVPPSPPPPSQLPQANGGFIHCGVKPDVWGVMFITKRSDRSGATGSEILSGGST